MAPSNLFNAMRMRNVGIMRVPYWTEDWIDAFGINKEATSSFIPSASGITFFSWATPPGYPDRAAPYEVQLFETLHRQLKEKNQRGLDAVVVFSHNEFRQSEEALRIAQGVKALKQNIRVISIQDTARPPVLAAHQFGVIDQLVSTKAANPHYHREFLETLSLPRSNLIATPCAAGRQHLTTIENLYQETFPSWFDNGTFNPRKLITLKLNIREPVPPLSFRKNGTGSNDPRL